MDKPPYRVPGMKEIEAIPWNGYKVVSTFSGTGGSCLGYRMAGYKVVWANEFVGAAQRCYRLNHPDSFLDTRDIRQIQPEEILRVIGLKEGELDIFDGSPPCDAFSTAGKREKGWRKQKEYYGKRQRTDDLFFEYSRLIRGLRPRVFIAENVSGLVKGTAKGYFKQILKELKDCGYRVKAKLLDAQWLGVPQMRQRIIFIGVRNDLQLEPVFPTPLPYFYSVLDAIPWLSAGGGSVAPVEPETDITPYSIGDEWDNLKPGESSDKYFSLIKSHPDKPVNTVTSMAGVSSMAGVTHPTERRKFSIAELKRICSFPDDFQLVGSFSAQWARLGLSVPPVMMRHIAAAVQAGILDKIP